MSQRGVTPALRVTVPTLGNSPSQRLSKYHIAFSPSPTPAPVIYQRPHNGRLWVAVLLQLSSLYAAHQWLIRSQQAQQPSVIKFAFLAFFGSSVALGFLQRPWKGRSVSSSQWLMVFVGGALLAASFLLRMQGLAVVGALETILAEYTGAVVGKVLIKTQRKVHGIEKAKIRGAVAFLVGLFLLSQGWAISSCSPLSSLLIPASRTRKFSTARLTRSTRIGYTSESRAYLSGEDVRSKTEEDCTKYVYILAPVFAGLLSSMQKLLPASTSLVNLPKKRLQALTYLTAGVLFIPAALFQLAFLSGGSGGLDKQVLWPLFSMIAFGMVLAFYGEFYSEEKLLISPLSPFHFFVTVCSVCILELTYGSNFSLLGFIVCSAILAVGVRTGAFISGGLDWNSISEKEYTGSSLFLMVKTPLYHIWTDVKSRKIAMFLLLNTSFMFVEFLYGFLSNSLGLISDACHMLFDCAALAIGLYASYISRLPPNSKFNFGYGRFEVLSGYANAVFLILVASLIVLESLERLLEPPEISTESLLVVSVGGLLVNVVGLMFFHEAHHHAHGSAPCTHVHHPDRVVPPSTPRWGEEQLGISLPRVLSSPKQKLVLTNVPDGFRQGGEDSPILHLQTSFRNLNDHAPQQPPSREEIGVGPKNDHFHPQNGLTYSGVQHLESHKQEHLQGSSPVQAAKNQFGHQMHKDHSPAGSQYGNRADCSSHIQHGDHSGGCGQHHQQDHADNLSPGHLSPLPSASEHQHSASCSHNHKNQDVQQNPFVHKGHVHSTHDYSPKGSHSHDHEHGQHISLERPLVQHSHSHSHDKQVGEDGDHHHDHGHDISNIYAASRSGTEHDQNVSVGFPREHDHSHGDDHHDHHYHKDGKREVSNLTSSDHGAGLSHYLDGHPGTKDHEHHHEEHHHHHHREEFSSLTLGDHGAGHSHHHGGQAGSHDHEHHHRDEGKSEVSSLRNRDHGAGHSHHHDGQHCSQEHGHHHVEQHNDQPFAHHHEHHHGCDHGHSHKHGGDHHHDHDHGHDEHGDHHHIDHNMEGIFLHILADTLGSVGVVISTLLIKYKGWLFTDPACSIFISALIVSSVLPLVRNSAELLLQRVPRSAEKRIQKALRKVEEVDGVHDWHKLHVWSYTNTELVGTLRLHASIGTNKVLVHKKVSRILEEAGIVDLTLEVEDLEHADDQ